jgi:hypothetical protein
MKRLRRFNESSVEEIDYDYIYQCFAELIDDEKAEIKLVKLDDEPFITLNLPTQKISYIDDDLDGTGNSIGIKENPVYNFIKNHNINNELLQELEVGLNRLSDKYPEYKIRFSEYSDHIFVEIHKNIKRRRKLF